MAPGDTGINRVNFAARHQLGFFNCSLNGLNGRVNIYHDTLLQSAGLMGAYADDLELALSVHVRDDRRNLVGTDIQRDDSLHLFISSHIYDPLFFG